MNVTRRQHYIPQFYLRRFADHKRRVRVYRRADGDIRLVNVNHVAVRTGFYDLVDDDGGTHTDVEGLLAQIEAEAAPALDRLTSGGFPPSREDRESIALFLATLVTRTPETRDSQRAIYDYLYQDLSQNEGMDNEAIFQLFERSRITVPSQNDDVRLTLSAAGDIVPYLLGRTWLLIRSRGHSFATSDHPIVTHHPDPDPLRPVGFANADEVYVPVDSRHLLALAHPRLHLPEFATDAVPASVLFANHLIAEHSYAFVFQHPDNEPLGDLMPKGPRPVFDSPAPNGSPIFGTESRRWSARHAE